MHDIPDNVRSACLNLFNDSRWRRIADTLFLHYADIDGAKVGVVVADSKRPQYQAFALNRSEFERLRDAEASGKIDKAIVVSVVCEGSDKTCVAVASAGAISAQLAGMTPRFGKLGEFWTAPNFSGEPEPF